MYEIQVILTNSDISAYLGECRFQTNAKVGLGVTKYLTEKKLNMTIWEIFKDCI